MGENSNPVPLQVPEADNGNYPIQGPSRPSDHNFINGNRSQSGKIDLLPAEALVARIDCELKGPLRSLLAGSLQHIPGISESIPTAPINRNIFRSPGSSGI